MSVRILKTAALAAALAFGAIGAAAADASPEWRARFGVLADMAGKDFAVRVGKQWYASAVRWEVPGQSLRHTMWWFNGDLVVVRFQTDGTGNVTGESIRNGVADRWAKPARVEARADSTVKVVWYPRGQIGGVSQKYGADAASGGFFLSDMIATKQLYLPVEAAPASVRADMMKKFRSLSDVKPPRAPHIEPVERITAPEPQAPDLPQM